MYKYYAKPIKKSAEDKHANFININILPKVANIYYHFSFLNSSRIYAGLWKNKPVSGFESASNVRELQKASIASRIESPLSSIKRATTSRVSDSIITG